MTSIVAHDAATWTVVSQTTRGERRMLAVLRWIAALTGARR